MPGAGLVKRRKCSTTEDQTSCRFVLPPSTVSHILRQSAISCAHFRATFCYLRCCLDPAIHFGACASELQALILAYDRSRTRGAHSLSGRTEGRLQAVGPGTGPGRWPRAPASPRAAGPPDPPRPTRPARSRALEFPDAPSRSGSRPSSGSSGNLIAGRLDLHRDGYGFVRPNRQSGAPGAPRAAEIEDVFIPPNEIGDAMQGDQVLVDVDPPKADGRRQAGFSGYSSAATPPSSARFVTPIPVAVTGKTWSSRSTNG